MKKSSFLNVSDDRDAIISDELNHASIIDGIRLAKAKKFRYKHIDLNDLEAKLKESKGKLSRYCYEWGSCNF